MKVDEYMKQAEMNCLKPASEFSKGDFILTATGGGKDLNFADFVDARENWNIGSFERLCQIVDIIDVAEDEDFLEDWLGKEAPAHKGGSASDDVDESRHQGSLTKVDYATFFDLITVFRKPSGKWIGVDCQGYEYWRYVHLPYNYEEVFAAERAEALRLLAEKEAKRKAEKDAELAEHAKALKERELGLKSKYFGLVISPANGRILGNNVRKFLAIEFPEIEVKVRANRSYFGNKYDVSVEVIGVSDEKKMAEIREVCKVWTETMPTGRIADDDYYGPSETRMCPMQMFGRVNGNFSFNFGGC